MHRYAGGSQQRAEVAAATALTGSGAHDVGGGGVRRPPGALT
jgi:hypothetical protein